MKALITLAVALTALPAAHAATSPPTTPGTAPQAATPLTGTPTLSQDELRTRVDRLSARARAHAQRLGLAPGPVARTPVDPELLTRRERRLAGVVEFLAQRREVGLAIDERPRGRARPAGPGLAARVAHQHSLVVQRSLALGVDRPAPLRLAPTREGRLAQLARWRSVARFLAARTERVRPDERPLSQRVRHHEALSCIARHEAGPEHGGWKANTGNGYYGGLQMDRSFQQTYAPGLYRAKGTADNWTPEEQMRAAGRAVATRGFHPWPNTARTCGLI